MVDADEVAGKTFSTSFRGYDTEEVRRYLGELADLLRERTDASARAAEVLREAQDEARRLRASVAAARDEAYAEGIAAAEVESARLVAEAEAAREHVLGDLARRRTVARAQVEQLHAARSKLLEALTDVGRSVEEARGRLVVALPEAKVAGEAAVRRVEAEPEPTIEQLESELEAFRLVGLPLAPPADEVVTVAVEVVEAEPADEPEPDPDVGVEVEPEVEPIVRAEVPAERGSEPDRPAEVEVEPIVRAEVPAERGSEPDRPSVDAVSAVFARLRNGSTPAAEPERESEPAAVAVAVAPRRPALAEVDGAAVLLERAARVVDPQTRLLRLAKRLLADEQNAVLDALRRVGVRPDAVTERAELERRWADAARPELVVAAAAGLAAADSADVEPPAVDDLAELLGGAVAGPLAERLVAAVERADGDHDLAADGVRSVCREWRSRRLDDDVEHAVLAAYARGALAAATAHGRSVCWVVDDGGTPCPDAEDNALAGLVAAGEPFPTGHTHPPAHPGCRCALATIEP